MTELRWLAVGMACGAFCVFAVLKWAQRSNRLAQVNERSSHTQPTPSMGGLGVMAVFLLWLAWEAFQSTHGWTDQLVWLLPVLALTVMGLWDDLRELPRFVRLVVQAVAVVFLVLGLRHLTGDTTVLVGDQQVVIPGKTHWLLVWPGLIAAALGLLWFVNLFNFMDGIDGIAGTQAFLFCLGAQLLSLGIPGWTGEGVWLLAGALLGFLAFNWPPAKLFMGDAGSQPLGLLIGGLVIYLAAAQILPLVGSLILLAGFWFDATWTLCVRMRSGQKFYQAHRSHLYQRLAQQRGHLWTTTAFAVFWLLWLLPLAAVAVWLSPTSAFATLSGENMAIDAGFTSSTFISWIPVVVAVLPLALACRHFGAGLELEHSLGDS